MFIRAAILDDDKVFCQVIDHYIKKIDFMKLEGVYHEPSSALGTANLDHIDLLFLDIEMPEMNGLEFLDSLGGSAPPVVIVSNQRKYGVDAFDYNAVDYLHKPVSFSRFVKTANKVRKSLISKFMEREDANHLFVRRDGLWVRLPHANVNVIKGNNNNVTIKTTDETFNSPMRLKDIDQKLPSADFMQIHRSYIINLNKVSKIDGEVLKIDGRTIPVSKTYIQELYKRLNIDR